MGQGCIPKAGAASSQQLPPGSTEAWARKGSLQSQGSPDMQRVGPPPRTELLLMKLGVALQVPDLQPHSTQAVLRDQGRDRTQG